MSIIKTIFRHHNFVASFGISMIMMFMAHSTAQGQATIIVEPMTPNLNPSPFCIFQTVEASFSITIDNPILKAEAKNKGIEKQVFTITVGDPPDGLFGIVVLKKADGKSVEFRRSEIIGERRTVERDGFTFAVNGDGNVATITGGESGPMTNVTIVEIRGAFRRPTPAEKTITLEVSIQPKTATEAAVGKGALSGRIEAVSLVFIDNRNRLKDPLLTNPTPPNRPFALGISNFVTTSNLPTRAATAFGTTNIDVDNFRISVFDPGRVGAARVQLQVLRGRDIKFDQTYDLTHLGTRGGQSRSDMLRLVSDEVDDLAAGGRPGRLSPRRDDDTNMQTILAQVGDTVRLTYTSVAGTVCRAELPVCSPAGLLAPDNILTTTLSIRVGFIDKPEDVIAFATVREQVRVAQQRWAQACIRFKISISSFRIPAGSIDAAGRFIIRNPGEANTKLMGDGGVSALAASFPSTDNITVYFVPPLGPIPDLPPGTVPTALSFDPLSVGIAEVIEGILRPGMPVRFGATQAVANTIFIGASPRGNRAPLISPFILSHEIGHILANTTDSAQPLQVLFPKLFFTIGTDDQNTVVGAKRLPDQRFGAPRLAVHVVFSGRVSRVGGAFDI